MREILTGEHVASQEQDVNQSDSPDITRSPVNQRLLNGLTRENPPNMAEAA